MNEFIIKLVIIGTCIIGIFFIVLAYNVDCTKYGLTLVLANLFTNIVWILLSIPIFKLYLKYKKK